MFVGIDVHKDTHTAVGISPFGEKLFEITVGNYKKDFETLKEKVDEVAGTLSPTSDWRMFGDTASDWQDTCMKSILYIMCQAFSLTELGKTQRIQRKVIPWMR